MPRVTTRATEVRPPEHLPSSVRVLVGASFLVAIGYGIVAPALPGYARSFGVGIATASTVVSAFAVFRLAFAPASGVLVRRLGEPPVFCIGLLIVGASSAACAFATSFGELLTYRAVGGIGSTMFTVSAAALLIRNSPPTMRGRAAGAWATWFLVGSIVGPLAGGVLGAVGPGVPFLAYGALLGAVAVGAAGALRVPRGTHAPEDDSDGQPVLTALRHPTFRAALATNFAYGWTVYGIRVSIVPLFLGEQLGWSAEWSAAALTAFAAGTAATSSLGGRLADRHGRRPMVRIGLVVMAVTLCWMGFSDSPVEIMLLAVLSGAGTGLTSPPTNAAVADILVREGHEKSTGSVLATYQMVGDVGAIAGPVLAGMVADSSGFPAAFVLTAAVVAAALTTWCPATEFVVTQEQTPRSRRSRRRNALA